MNSSTGNDTFKNLADRAVGSTDNAIKATESIANSALDGLADSAQGARLTVAPLVQTAGAQASDMAHRGIDAVRGTTHELRDRAQRASDSTVSYIKDDPLKAMLIAAATGAALMALVTLLSRPHAHA